MKWFIKAAEQDDNHAGWLASRYDEGAGVPEDKSEAVKWYLKAAEEGSIEGDVEYILGERYYSGVGVPQDKSEALKWFRKAVELGNEDAQKEVEKIEAEINSQE